MKTVDAIKQEMKRVCSLRSESAVVVKLLQQVLDEVDSCWPWQAAMQAHAQQEYGLAWTWMYVHNLDEIERYRTMLDSRKDESRRIWWFSSSAGRWNQTPNKKKCDNSRSPCSKCKAQGFHAIRYRLRRTAPFTINGKKKTQQKWLPRQLSESELAYINACGWMMDADMDMLVKIVTEQYSPSKTNSLKELCMLPPTIAVQQAKQLVLSAEMPIVDNVVWDNGNVIFHWIVNDGNATMYVSDDELHFSTQLTVDGAQAVVSELQRLGKVDDETVRAAIRGQISTISDKIVTVEGVDPVRLHHLVLRKQLLESDLEKTFTQSA